MIGPKSLDFMLYAQIICVKYKKMKEKMVFYFSILSGKHITVYDSDSLFVDLDKFPVVPTWLSTTTKNAKNLQQNTIKKNIQKDPKQLGSSSKTFLNSSLTKFFKSIALPPEVPVAVALPPAVWAAGGVRRGRGGRAAATGGAGGGAAA